MFIIVSGVDGSGKSTIAKELHNVLSGDKYATISNSYSLIDTAWAAPRVQNYKNKESLYSGFNLALAQMFNSMDYFIRDRGSIDERVYSQKFNRSDFNWRVLDNSGLNKQILILLRPTYKKYLKNMESRRGIETPVQEQEYNSDVKAFENAFGESSVRFKFIIDVNDDESIDVVIEKILVKIIPIIAIDHIQKNALDKKNEAVLSKFDPTFNIRLNLFISSILTCSRCPMINECAKVNPDYAKPVLPRIMDNTQNPNEVLSLFVGIAPGRGINKPYSIECFTHSSGKYLEKLINELGLSSASYITNLIKCNTTSDKKFDPESVRICFETFLSKEILMFPNLKYIVLLGNDVYNLINDFISIDKIESICSKLKNKILITKIKHPSHINYSGDRTKAMNDYIIDTKTKLGI